MRLPSFYTPAVALFASVSMFTACGEKPKSESLVPETSAAGFEIPAEADTAVRAIFDQLAKGNGEVLWKAMPLSYQTDVTSVAQLAGSKLDSEIYDKVFQTIDRLAVVADKQKDFLFNTDIGPQPPEEEAAKFRAAWPSLVNILETVANSPVSSTLGLQSFDGEVFFGDTISTILSDVDALAQLQPDRGQSSISDYALAVVNLIEGTDSKATLEITTPDGKSHMENLLKVESRWVPEELASQWTQFMTDAKGKLEAFNPADFASQKTQLMGVFTMVEGVLSQIEAAETQEEFDQALQGAIMPLMGIFMMFQGMSVDAPVAPSMPALPALP